MMRKFLASLCWVGILAGSALALTGAEYQEMLKDPGFVAADKALNQAWAEAKKVMPKAAFEALKKEQGAWVAKGRDTEAKEFMKNGMEAPKAYALVTEMRMRAIQTAAEDAFLMGNPSGVQGFYVRKGKGGEDGWLKVYNRTLPNLEAKIEAVRETSPGNANVGELSGRGRLKDGVAEFVDPEAEEARMTVTFKGDTATVTTSLEFKQSGWCGMGVVLDGTYVRQKVKK
ncbi:lysozyme inhibitor LprI family protein [uncultured Fretibacterium sp.]|uniref:lysozyme inhibitor LprI family protein n=1 Tax=uncultured Fretibacterium sp. TaxID=1678694 RepID=UPI0026212AC2|nr:lysozyme inhibitor LprI family protein [uncultured Fretibacterium sp.]